MSSKAETGHSLVGSLLFCLTFQNLYYGKLGHFSTCLSKVSFLAWQIAVIISRAFRIIHAVTDTLYAKLILKMQNNMPAFQIIAD